MSSENSQVLEMEELRSMYDDICNKLYDRPELLKVFRDLVSRDDPDYETESSSEEEDIDEGEPEEIEVNKTEDGFYSLA